MHIHRKKNPAIHFIMKVSTDGVIHGIIKHKKKNFWEEIFGHKNS